MSHSQKERRTANIIVSGFIELWVFFLDDGSTKMVQQEPAVRVVQHQDFTVEVPEHATEVMCQIRMDSGDRYMAAFPRRENQGGLRNAPNPYAGEEKTS